MAVPNTESIFTKAQIYYGAPVGFNDPFDCNLKIHTNGSSDSDWEAHLDDLIASVPDPTIRSLLLQHKVSKSWNTMPQFKDIGKKQHKEHYEDSSVFCLSRKANSIPMFSYYADSHAGIAIEFTFGTDRVPCGFSFGKTDAHGTPYEGKLAYDDVTYQSPFPELNFHKLRNVQGALIRHLIFTKSDQWAHEEEFRIFRMKVPKSLVSFDRELLTKVVFGCKTTSADVDLVKTWLKGWPSDVTLARAEQVANRFELIVTDFEVVKGP